MSRVQDLYCIIILYNSIAMINRRDEENNREFLVLKTELQSGIESGISNKTFHEIWEEGRQEALTQKTKENK
ncbi:MAG: hypothetical protein WA913_02380 [Pricia sp.]